MRKLLLLLSTLLAITSLASGAIVDCSTITSLSQLTVDNAGVGNGCVDQDKEYTNFVYNPTGGVDPDDVAVNISFGAVGPLELHVVSLQAGAVGWTNPFTLSYSILVTDPERYIDLIQLDATFTGGFLGNVTQTNTPAGSVNPIVATNLGGSAQTSIFTSQLDVVITGTPGLVSSIQQFTSTYTQNTTVPEPATYAMFGAGLLGLAFYRRRGHS